MGKFFGYLIGLAILCVVAAGGVVGYFVLEGDPPDLEIISAPSVMGREYLLEIKARDERSGLRVISAAIIQDEKIVDLDAKAIEVIDWWRGSGVKEKTASWAVRPLTLGLSEGKALLRVSVRDSSWRGGLKGNERVWQADVEIDLSPPRIAVMSTVHNLANGGSGLVTYRVGETPSRTGVWLDSRFFPGYLKPDGPEGTYVAMMAVPFDLKAAEQVLVEAVDPAGNVARSGVPHRIRYRAVKRDRIVITDRFLSQKMPDFMVRYPEIVGNDFEVFLQVNQALRRRNNDEIRSHCLESVDEILWAGSFVTLPRSASKAGFADERHYFYKGKEIDQTHHLGVDLASVRHATVPAGNSGVVVFADYLGIYGNTVILDHGLGLFSMYSHLSEIQVAPGDGVERGQGLGRTGTTGLAGGDHLHYAMLVNGEFVNPVEWWDQKWIEDHILHNLSAQ